MDFKNELAKKAGNQNHPTVGNKTDSIIDTLRAMEPEFKKALPSMISPERFIRMAINAVNMTPKLTECTSFSFLAALMNAAQLGLEPNTPLGQAYLIPYRNKDHYECQFQIGYKGMLELVYRSDQVASIEARCVYQNDFFEYEYGMHADIVHRPAVSNRGELTFVYAIVKLKDGSCSFEVMSRENAVEHAQRYSKGLDSSYSPWKSDFEAMAKKTVIKAALKYAPLKTEVQKALATDGTIKNQLSVDMTEIRGEEVYPDDGQGSKEEL